MVHPKGTRLVYAIQCKDCLIGETGRRFRTRQKEHIKDIEPIEGIKYTSTKQKESLIKIHQSALTDHVASKKHTIEWDDVRLPAKDDWKKRGLKEAIFIRKSSMCAINWDEVATIFPMVYCETC